MTEEMITKNANSKPVSNATGIEIRTEPKTNQRAASRWILRSKIHRATVTKVNADYTDSIGIDENLVKKAGFLPGEKVLVVDITSGGRLETYVIAAKRNSGTVCMNGPSALVIKKGDLVIIMGFELSESSIEPRKVQVDKDNKFIGYL